MVLINEKVTVPSGYYEGEEAVVTEKYEDGLVLLTTKCANLCFAKEEELKPIESVQAENTGPKRI